MRNTSDIISISFGIVMIFLVLVGSIIFSFTDYMDDRLYGQKRVFFVVILVAYAIYRVFRLMPLLKKNNRIDKDSL